MFDLLESFCNYILKQKRYSQNTVVSYRTDLKQFLTYCSNLYEISEIKEIRHTIVRSWIVARMEAGDNEKSINRKISSLRSFFQYLKRKEHIEKNPMSKIIAPKIPKRLPEFIREDSLEKLFDTLNEDETYASLRDRLIIELLYSTGMRRAELISIKEGDIKFHDGLLKVLGKGNKERLIPINGRLLEKLEKLIQLKNENFENYNEFLFLTDRGKQVYPKFVYNKVIALLSLVSTAKKKSPHILRHSFATHLTNNGADINAIKELLGHANLAATQIYTHNSIAKLKEVYSKTHPKAKRGEKK